MKVKGYIYESLTLKDFVWQLIGTSFDIEGVKFYKTRRGATAAANHVAKNLNLEIKWEK